MGMIQHSNAECLFDKLAQHLIRWLHEIGDLKLSTNNYETVEFEYNFRHMTEQKRLHLRLDSQVRARIAGQGRAKTAARAKVCRSFAGRGTPAASVSHASFLSHPWF